MNCPESTFIYRSKLRSYRDLPLRFNEFGRLHRNERSGTLSRAHPGPPVHPGRRAPLRPAGPADRRDRGAARRGPRGVSAGSASTPRFAFATKPDKAIGDPALWERAETTHPGGARPRPTSATCVKPKDGTFYAPKIDIYIDDALGREWQMATIQIDLTMLPERFDLTYIDEEGKPQRPIAIHRAIYGSLERFIGILIEHFAGAFPLWVAPVQAVVIPIADRHVDAARGAGGRPPAVAGCGSRSTTRPTGCSTRSGRRRSRRSRTWSCWATARSRHGRRRPEPEAASSSRPKDGTSWRSASQSRAASGASRERSRLTAG